VINQLYPVARGDVSDDALLELYGSTVSATPYVRANMISSVDGSATAEGLSGALGTASDKRVFELLRQLCDVVLVGAGTIRDEGYGALRVGADAAAWRVAHGRAEHPVLAIVSGRLELNPTSAVFTEAPVRPIVLTVERADAALRGRLGPVADVINCGADTFDPVAGIRALGARGYAEVLCEGGPTLLGDLVAASIIDELCLSLSPNLEGGFGPRITHLDSATTLRAMRLAHVLESEGLLLLRYISAHSDTVEP
jgi:riboflavin biosynthesis pyrimidine reductase